MNELEEKYFSLDCDRFVEIQHCSVDCSGFEVADVIALLLAREILFSSKSQSFWSLEGVIYNSRCGVVSSRFRASSGEEIIIFFCSRLIIAIISRFNFIQWEYLVLPVSFLLCVLLKAFRIEVDFLLSKGHWNQQREEKQQQGFQKLNQVASLNEKQLKFSRCFLHSLS